VGATTSAEASPDHEGEVDADLATSRSVNALSPQPGHKEPVRGRSMSCLRIDAPDDASSVQPTNPGDWLVRIEWIRVGRDGAEERQRKVLSVSPSATVPDLIEMVRRLCCWSAPVRAACAASAHDAVAKRMRPPVVLHVQCRVRFIIRDIWRYALYDPLAAQWLTPTVSMASAHFGGVVGPKNSPLPA